MKVVIAGGSGFLGQALTRRLLADGHTVIILSRNPDPPSKGRASEVAWNPDGSAGPWANTLEGADAVINLAGAGMADKRWTEARKKVLRSSRILSTRSLVRAVESLTNRPATFIQGSAVGYYGASLNDRSLDESAPAGHDFLGQLASEWEAEAKPVEGLGCRLVIVRTGIALDARDGALRQMAQPFKFFAGGHLASGRQIISWIHADDWVSLIVWLLKNPSASGPWNATAPTPATSRDLARAIGRALGRPSWFPVPPFVLRVVVGEMADAALVLGQSAVPARAVAASFSFAHADLDEAVRHALKLR